MIFRSLFIPVICFLLAGSGELPGQDKGTKDFELEYHWEFRLRSELQRNYDLQGARPDDNNPLLQRFRFSLEPRYKSIRFFAQVQDSPVWFKDKSPYRSVDFHMHQLYADLPVGNEFRLRIGRQEINFGEQRLIGALPWSNSGRSFDAVMLYREKNGRILSFFAGNLPSPRERGFVRSQNVFGASWKASEKTQSLELYGFLLHDLRVLRGEERPGRARILTSGARFTKQLQNVKHVAEGAWQVGTRSRDEHLAGAFTYRVDRGWDARHAPTVGAEYSFATGDGNPSDGKSREFHNLYPTNHGFYGYIDFMGWRNVHNVRLYFSFQPRQPLRIEVNYHELWLHRARGRWTNAGGSVLGFDPLGASGRRVGNELDLTAAYSVGKHWKTLLGYSLFNPGRFAKATRGPDAAHFTYLQLQVNY